MVLPSKRKRGRERQQQKLQRHVTVNSDCSSDTDDLNHDSDLNDTNTYPTTRATSARRDKPVIITNDVMAFFFQFEESGVRLDTVLHTPYLSWLSQTWWKRNKSPRNGSSSAPMPLPSPKDFKEPDELRCAVHVYCGGKLEEIKLIAIEDGYPINSGTFLLNR